MKPVYDKFITDPKLKDMVQQDPGIELSAERAGGAAGRRRAARPPSHRARGPAGAVLRGVHAHPLQRASLAKYCMIVAVAGLSRSSPPSPFQVFGRYVMNDTPTWAESLALVLILYVTLFGAAVGVRDAGHIGMESLLVLVPERVRGCGSRSSSTCWSARSAR